VNLYKANNQTHIFELENTKKDADPTTVKLKAKKELTGKELSAVNLYKVSSFIYPSGASISLTA
jgi:hypothetical protein